MILFVARIFLEIKKRAKACMSSSWHGVAPGSIDLMRIIGKHLACQTRQD